MPETRGQCGTCLSIDSHIFLSPILFTCRKIGFVLKVRISGLGSSRTTSERCDAVSASALPRVSQPLHSAVQRSDR
jgi:hypothetical protein